MENLGVDCAARGEPEGAGIVTQGGHNGIASTHNIKDKLAGSTDIVDGVLYSRAHRAHRIHHEIIHYDPDAVGSHYPGRVVPETVMNDIVAANLMDRGDCDEAKSNLREEEHAPGDSQMVATLKGQNQTVKTVKNAKGTIFVLVCFFIHFYTYLNSHR